MSTSFVELNRIRVLEEKVRALELSLSELVAKGASKSDAKREDAKREDGKRETLALKKPN